MKLLMTCDAVGGVWQYANDLARGLAGAGVEVLLAVLGPGTAVASRDNHVRIIHTDLPLDWLASGPGEVLAAGRAIAALAAEHRVDLIHLNSPALAAAGRYPAPIVAFAHGCIGTWFSGLGEQSPRDLVWHEEMLRTGLHAADVVAAPSAAYAAAVRRHYQLPVTPEVIHNGRVPMASPEGGSADHVLTVGRLWDRAKNTGLLDRVAAILPVPLRAAGAVDAPHGETIRTEHLHLLGKLEAEALAAEYARAPIFISAARFEPFGLAVLEAAQAGCPLVLSDIDSFRELWTGAALLVSADDPAAYADAVQRIRADGDLRAHLADAARARATRYSVEAMTAGTLALYRDLLARPQAQAA